MASIESFSCILEVEAWVEEEGEGKGKGREGGGWEVGLYRSLRDFGFFSLILSNICSIVFTILKI